jgi:hypothetical protein
MKKALKVHCVPVLRDRGFQGTFPNFYRDSDAFIALAHFQFYRNGESFSLVLGFADPERRNVVSHCRDLEPKNLRLRMTGSLVENGNYLSGRWYVGQEPIGDGHYGGGVFEFAPGQYGGDRSVEAVSPEDVACRCAALLRAEAEAWWEGRRAFAAATAGQA